MFGQTRYVSPIYIYTPKILEKEIRRGKIKNKSERHKVWEKKGKKRKQSKHGMGEIIWVLLCDVFYDILYFYVNLFEEPFIINVVNVVYN